jgi:DNA mismatch repair protein MutS2
LAQESENGLKTVPINIRLSPDKRILVISGINAGGKTVALKTLGLLMLMAQTGLHLPVGEGSTLVFFDHIMAVIGDEQDIQSDRSTFSGHIRRLNQIMEMASENSLVLLDELGTGTDPAEGAALALAVLDDFRTRKVWVMTATHYHLLKAWARLSQGAENASVRTNPDGRPAFGLEYGSPGFSAGLAMARGLGMDGDIVARAESYLDEGQKKTIDLMQRLEEERAELAAIRSRADFLVEELARACNTAKVSEKARIEAQEKEMAALRREVNRSIKRFEDEFKDIKKNLKDRADIGKVTAEVGQAKKQIKKLVETPVRVRQPLRQVGPGDWVLVWGLGKEGRVVSVDQARRKAEVDISGMKIHAPYDDLASPQKRKKEKTHGRKINYTIVRDMPREINLLGYTIDEALPEVEKSLDQARLGGLKHFSIIHGIGTGRLRQAIRGYLQGDTRVKDFHSGDQRSGGDGVTMVELTD